MDVEEPVPHGALDRPQKRVSLLSADNASTISRSFELDANGEERADANITSSVTPSDASKQSSYSISRNESDLITTSLRFEGPGCWVHGLAHVQDEDHEDYALSQSGDDARPKRWRLWLLVCVASVVSGFFTFFCSAFGSFLQSLCSVPQDSELFQDFVKRAFWQICLCVAAYAGCLFFAALRTDRQIGQFMGGSGIPELKCELGGVHLTGLFNWRIICGKLLGLSFMTGAGLPTGFEGPFVHASCCVGHFLMCKFSVFKPLLFVRHLRHMAMITMVAVGVSCTFATPLGGVLFALEVTDSFASAAYLHCYFGATIAGIVSTLLRRCVFGKDSWWHYKLLFSSDLQPISLTVIQEFWFLCLYAVLGLICGVLGAFFVWLHRFFFSTIGKITARYKGDRKKIATACVVAGAGVIYTVLTWTNPFFRKFNSNGLAIGALTGKAPIDWGIFPTWHMAYSIFTRFTISALVLALPLPNGSVAPTFVLGALLGRAFGNICWVSLDQDWFFQGEGEHEILKEEFVSRFALVGASAFVAGSMRSFAQVVIVFERVAMPNMLIPLCACSLVALFVANAMELNFFDSMIQLKRLPHLPSLAQGRGALLVGDILSTAVPVITSPLTREKVVGVRKRFPNWQHEVPIVLALAREGSKTFHVDHADSDPTEKEQLVVVSALRSFPSALLQADPSSDVVTPLHVSSDTTLKALLPLLTSLDKTVAFVTKDGFLVGAVSLTDLYSRAIRG